MKEIVFVFLLQMLLTAGSTLAAGLFIRGCKRLLVEACGRYAPQIVNGAGIIGTPVHELSHAAMCIVFRHKIKRIKLFSIDKNSTALGFVEHSYNRHSLWQRIGNFFIGVAPVFAGSAVLLLLLRLFLPTVFAEVQALLAQTAALSLSSDTPLQLLRATGSVFRLVFDTAHFSSWQYPVFLLLALTIAVHMDLSTADIKGGANGFLFYAAFFLILDVVLYFLNPAWLTVFTDAVVRGGLYLTSLLLMCVVFAAAVGILSLLVIFIKKLF